MKNYKAKNVVIVIVAFFVGAIAMYGVIRNYPIVLTTTTTKLEKDVTVTDEGIADAVEKVYDSVVVVKTYKDNKVYSSGTGFVYKKEDGLAYILTNNHVIESGNKIKVVFTNGKEEEVTKVDSDKYADIAVLSIAEEKIISVATIGDSSALRVGDTSFAVGAPLDSAYSWSVTRGIISGKDRLVEVSVDNSSSSNWIMSVIQTDTAINSGNSGGPLCNSNGEVVGINSLKLVSSGVEGMGFAIPIETAVEYAEKFISGDTDNNKTYLGVSTFNVTDAYYYRDLYSYVADSNLDNGVLIVEVEKDSPADKGGLKEGDIIVGIEEYEVTKFSYLSYYLSKFEVGDKVTIKYYRNGESKETKVTLAKKDN